MSKFNHIHFCQECKDQNEIGCTKLPLSISKRRRKRLSYIMIKFCNCSIVFHKQLFCSFHIYSIFYQYQSCSYITVWQWDHCKNKFIIWQKESIIILEIRFSFFKLVPWFLHLLAYLYDCYTCTYCMCCLFT